jgi:hypothetical protein
VNWFKKNIVLAFCIVIPFLAGGYFLGKSVKEDYRTKPGYDAAEVRWSLIEAYAGGAILFGSIGALVFYIASAIIKKGD